jgi:hypothetical protein
LIRIICRTGGKKRESLTEANALCALGNSGNKTTKPEEQIDTKMIVLETIATLPFIRLGDRCERNARIQIFLRNPDLLEFLAVAHRLQGGKAEAFSR